MFNHDAFKKRKSKKRCDYRKKEFSRGGLSFILSTRGDCVTEILNSLPSITRDH